MKQACASRKALAADRKDPGGTIEVQLLYRNVQRFRGGLVFKAHRLLYHSILGLGVMKKKRRGTP